MEENRRKEAEVDVAGSNLKELDNDDILSVTCNGKIVETRARDLLTIMEKEENNKQRRTSMKQMAQANSKGASNISGAKR